MYTSLGILWTAVGIIVIAFASQHGGDPAAARGLADAITVAFWIHIAIPTVIHPLADWQIEPRVRAWIEDGGAP